MPSDRQKTREILLSPPAERTRGFFSFGGGRKTEASL